jgi:uncharacterized membrane protein
MSPAQHEVGDESRGRARSGNHLSRLLLAGLVIAIGLMVAGAVLAAVRGSGSVQKASSIGRLPQLLAAGDPTGFLDLGLLVLLATPFARAVALCGDFVRRRHWLFAGISMAVVAVLVLSGLLGLL